MNKKAVFFVGIGGIGMSGLAHIMKNMGFKIQGSDKDKNNKVLQKKLRKKRPTLLEE